MMIPMVTSSNWILLIIVLIMFLIVHFIKMMRLYLVFLEEKIEFKRFVCAYMRTTLVNLIIPFKLGELYRMFVFSRTTGSAYIGIFGVLIDRFFDTMALVLLLLPLQILYPGTVTFVSMVLLLAIVLIICIYLVFMPSYKYLNRYIIMNRTSKRSMAVLRTLEVTRNGYDYIKKLVSGRYAIMILMSIFAWGLEGALLMILSRAYNVAFGGSDFAKYIASILSTSYSSDIKEIYTIISIVLMLVLTILSLVVLLIFKNKDVTDEKSNRNI